MTEEQLIALELWIIAIIHDMERGSDIHEAVTRMNKYQRVKEVFGLAEPVNGN